MQGFWKKQNRLFSSFNLLMLYVFGRQQTHYIRHSCTHFQTIYNVSFVFSRTFVSFIYRYNISKSKSYTSGIIWSAYEPDSYSNATPTIQGLTPPLGLTVTSTTLEVLRLEKGVASLLSRSSTSCCRDCCWATGGDASGGFLRENREVAQWFEWCWVSHTSYVTSPIHDSVLANKGLWVGISFLKGWIRRFQALIFQELFVAAGLLWSKQWGHQCVKMSRLSDRWVGDPWERQKWTKKCLKTHSFCCGTG